jgi:hypothetical protein
MRNQGYIVDFNQSDGLPQLAIRKLNDNFHSLMGQADRLSVAMDTPSQSEGGGGGGDLDFEYYDELLF